MRAAPAGVPSDQAAAHATGEAGDIAAVLRADAARSTRRSRRASAPRSPVPPAPLTAPGPGACGPRRARGPAAGI